MKKIIDQAGLGVKKKKAADELLTLDTQYAYLMQISSLLSWDQELHMPSWARQGRAEQLAYLETEIHAISAHHRIAQLLHVLEVDDTQPMGNSEYPEKMRLWLRAKYRDWKRQSSLPPSLLADFKRECSIAFHNWIEARKKKSFAIFKNSLKKIITFNQEIADCIGYESSPYDALLDRYEPGCRTNFLSGLFTELRKKLAPIYTTLCHKDREKKYKQFPCVPVDQQRKFSEYLCTLLSFRKEQGHVGESHHPFTITLGHQDLRITTKYDEQNVLVGIFSLLHEIGHALYDLGCDPVFHNTICGRGASFAVHESQSRLMENGIGRSWAFWEHAFPVLCGVAPDMASLTLQEFMSYILRVQRSPIRIEADEVGYTMHIIIRFELEKDLIEGKLRVDDLAELWNEKYRKNLGVSPGNVCEGILQDVHWSQGYFGYFPSYSLGNLYAARLLQEMYQHIPLDAQLRKGDFSDSLAFLGKRIHIFGASKLPEELLPLEIDSFCRYIERIHPT